MTVFIVKVASSPTTIFFSFYIRFIIALCITQSRCITLHWHVYNMKFYKNLIFYKNYSLLTYFHWIYWIMKEINRHHLIYPSTTAVTNYWFLLKQNSQKGIQNQSKHLRWTFLQKQLMAKGWLFFTLHPRCLYSSKYCGLNNWNTFIDYNVVYLVFGQTVFYVKPTRC